MADDDDDDDLPKLTDEEKEQVRAVRERAKELDMDFLVKLYCSRMVKRKPDYVVAHVIAFLEAAHDCCIEAASKAGTEIIARGISVDRAIDGMRVFMELSETLSIMGGLLKHALVAEDHGEYGLFTSDAAHLNKLLEDMRRSLVLLKNKHDLEQRRRRR